MAPSLRPPSGDLPDDPGTPEHPLGYDILKQDKKDLKVTGAVRQDPAQSHRLVLGKPASEADSLPWVLVQSLNVSSQLYKLKLNGAFVCKGKDDNYIYADPSVKEADADTWNIAAVPNDPRPGARIIVSGGGKWQWFASEEGPIQTSRNEDASDPQDADPYIFCLSNGPKDNST